MKALFAILLLSAGYAKATPTVAMAVAQAVAASGSYVVTATAGISVSPGDPAYIAGSLDLVRLDTATPTVLGIMHDDGMNGDAVAGDGVYTLQFTASAATVATLQVEASAAFRGLLLRVKSAAVPAQIVAPALTSVNPGSGAPGQQNLSVVLTGANTHFSSGTTAAFGGNIAVASLTVTSATTANAVLNIPLTTAPGAYSVTVTSGSESVALNNAFTVTAGASITQVIPNSGYQGQTGLSVAITGANTHFAQGTTVANFGAGVTVNSLTVNSTTSATANLTISGAATIGSNNVTMTTGSEAATLVNGFSITAAPAITQVNPNSGQQGQTGLSVAITGSNTHFAQGTTVANFGAGVTVNSLAVNSTTSATANLTISGAATIGSNNVTMTTGSEAATLVNGFSITAAPAITQVNPNSGYQGQTGLSVTISGSNTHFAQGTTVANFGAGVTVNSLAVNSTSSATANLTISGAATIGSNNVTMTTGSEVATLVNGFSITAAPTITQVNPNSGLQGQSGLSVTITGANTHFAQGTTVANFGTANIAVASLTVNSVTSATAVLNIAAATTVGNYTVSMTTGSEVATLTNGFSVTAQTFPTDVVTYHYDNTRSGLNSNETILTPANVGVGLFKAAEYTLDGRVDGQVLYLNNLTIPNLGPKNVVFVATENDSVYAFDAAGFSGSTATVLWHMTLLQSGETALPQANQPCGNIFPSGVTGTPVIDRGRNAIYVESVSLTGGGATVHRLHALSLTTGAELFGGPTTITATAAGTAGNVLNGVVTFDPSVQHARAALAEAGGVIYIAYSGLFGDCGKYSPWVLGYSADTLAQTTSIDLAPNNTGGGMWMGGSGPAVDSAGNLYVHTGNGFSGGLPNASNYVNSAVRMTTNGGLAVADYYAPAATVSDDNADLDFGSTGPLLLPDQVDTNSVTRHLSVSATKDGNIYVLNRDNLGQYNGSTETSYQMFHAFTNVVVCTAVYFNGTVYFYGSGAQSLVASIQAYAISNALLPTTPSFHGTVSFSRGCPSISSNGATNGIVWAVDNSAGVLYALNATTLVQLYRSPASSFTTDQGGFVTPTVANGRVYFGTGSTIVVFALGS